MSSQSLIVDRQFFLVGFQLSLIPVLLVWTKFDQISIIWESEFWGLGFFYAAPPANFVSFCLTVAVKAPVNFRQILSLSALSDHIYLKFVFLLFLLVLLSCFCLLLCWLRSVVSLVSVFLFLDVVRFEFFRNDFVPAWDWNRLGQNWS